MGLDAGWYPPVARRPRGELRRVRLRRSNASSHPASARCSTRIFSATAGGGPRSLARATVRLSLAARGSRHLARVGGGGGLAALGGDGLSAAGPLRPLGHAPRAGGDRAHPGTGAARPGARRLRGLRTPGDRPSPTTRSREAQSRSSEPRHQRGAMRIPLPRSDRRRERARPPTRRGRLAPCRRPSAGRSRRRRQRAPPVRGSGHCQRLGPNYVASSGRPGRGRGPAGRRRRRVAPATSGPGLRLRTTDQSSGVPRRWIAVRDYRPRPSLRSRGRERGSRRVICNRAGRRVRLVVGGDQRRTRKTRPAGPPLRPRQLRAKGECESARGIAREDSRRSNRNPSERPTTHRR